MKRIRKALIVLFVLGSASMHAQSGPKKFNISGHLETLEMIWMKKIDSTWTTMNTIYNRIDLRYYPSNSFTFHFGLRNLLDYGQLVTNINHLSKAIPDQPDYESFVVKDDGYFNLAKVWSGSSSYTLYSNIDRLNLSYTKDNFEATLGRQRINWGVNMVWNPNDIFNTFNYFNFDYVERPGCDALRLQYYTSFTSSMQLAAKINHKDELTVAGMYKFNKWNYDFQLIAGAMNDDYVMGLGWSGQIETAGFNGEASYFHARKNFSDSSGQLVASIGANYTFRSGLYFQVSGLYNSKGSTGKAGRGNMFAMNLDVSPKTLTPARYSLFGQASYPVTPLIKANISGIYNPNDQSGFFGPSIDLSLKQNLSLLAMGQLFMGDNGTEFGDYGTIIYLRLKWSF